jgi:hypothetical protein
VATIDALIQLFRDPAVSDDALRKGLKHRAGLVVASAARNIAENDRTGFEAQLSSAFGRLCTQASKRDPGCQGKTWVCKALRSWPADEVLLKGARFVQLDPAWGPPEDVSTEMRCLCTLELVGRGCPEAPGLLAERLAESSTVCQVTGARGVVAWNDPALGALLRLRVLLYATEDPELLSECFEGLLILDAEANRDFVERWLMDDGPRAECALLALAGTRQECMEHIQAWLGRHVDPRMRKVGFIALALLRTDEARAELDHLIQWGTATDQAMATEARGL